MPETAESEDPKEKEDRLRHAAGVAAAWSGEDPDERRESRRPITMWEDQKIIHFLHENQGVPFKKAAVLISRTGLYVTYRRLLRAVARHSRRLRLAGRRII